MLDGGGNSEPTKAVGPVVTPDKKDEDPWKEVAKQTAAGEVRFEPMAAQLAAQECADAIGGILGVQKTISDMGTLKELSQLLSGGVLAIQFNNTLHGLNDVLNTHKTTLDQMLNTFKAAGTKYIDTDLDSATGFDKKTRDQMKEALANIKAPTTAGKPRNDDVPKLKDVDIPKSESVGEDGEKIPLLSRDYLNTVKVDKNESATTEYQAREEYQARDLVKPANLPKGLMDYTGETQTQPTALQQWRLEKNAKPENPDSQEWADLYNLGKSTERAIKPVSHASDMWKWMAKELTDTVGAFSTKLTSIPDSLWKGEGADSAVGAVKKYHAKADNLSERMRAVGANLEYTSQWLADTKKGMPTEPTPPKPVVIDDSDASSELPGGGATITQDSENLSTAATNKRNLAIYRQNMENNYVQGVQASSLFVPALDELPVTAATKPEDAPKDGDTGGGQNNNTGGGSDNTGGGQNYGGQNNGGPSATNYNPTSPPVVPQDTSDYSTQTKSPSDANSQTPTNPAGADPTSPTSGTDALSKAANLAQNGLGGAESAIQAAARAAQEAGAAGSGLNAARAGLPGGLGTPGGGSSGINAAAKVGGGGGGLGSGAAAAALQKEADAARMFPRANAAGPAPASALGRMGGMSAAGMPTNGTPGSPGAAGAGQGQGQGKEHKRPNYLESSKHLEEALGDAPTVVRAVVEK